MTKEDLQTRLEDLANRQQDILAKVQAEKRDPSEEERRELDGMQESFDRTEEDLQRLMRHEAQINTLAKPNGRKTEPAQESPHPAAAPGYEPEQLATRGTGRAAPVTYYREVARRGDGGFRSLGEMAYFVRLAARPGGMGVLDDRLAKLATPTTYANEGVGAEGGYAVPPDFRTAIMEKIQGEASLMSRTDQITTSSNVLTIPKDNSTPWGTSGMRAYWGSEGALKTQSRPALESMSLRLHKVYALIPITDELAEDAPAMDTYLRRKAPEYIDFAINLAIVQGTGSMQPLGILNSPALVTVTKESSQLADTIVPNNIIKMWSRLYAPNRANAVWLVNQDIETQLYTMAMPGKDNTGLAVSGWGSHVFMPAGGLSGSPYSTLFGKPVIPTQACETLGDLGDIILWDPKSYLTVIKGGQQPKVDVSMHLWFDYDISAYRFVLRMTGQPWWDAAVTPRDGNNTLSTMVTLEARA